jgi:hypothetical protein
VNGSESLKSLLLADNHFGTFENVFMEDRSSKRPFEIILPLHEHTSPNRVIMNLHRLALDIMSAQRGSFGPNVLARITSILLVGHRGSEVSSMGR